MGRTGQGVLTWIWKDVPSFHLHKGREGKLKDIRES